VAIHACHQQHWHLPLPSSFAPAEHCHHCHSQVTLLHTGTKLNDVLVILCHHHCVLAVVAYCMAALPMPLLFLVTNIIIIIITIATGWLLFLFSQFLACYCWHCSPGQCCCHGSCCCHCPFAACFTAVLPQSHYCCCLLLLLPLSLLPLDCCFFMILMLQSLFFKTVCFCGCCCLIYAAATADPFALVLLIPLLLLLAVVIPIAIVASCRLIVVSF